MSYNIPYACQVVGCAEWLIIYSVIKAHTYQVCTYVGASTDTHTFTHFRVPVQFSSCESVPIQWDTCLWIDTEALSVQAALDGLIQTSVITFQP